MFAAFTTKLKDSRGRVYIPKDVMEGLKLHKGSFITMQVSVLNEDIDK